jgi:ATP synthase protein I
VKRINDRLKHRVQLQARRMREAGRRNFVTQLAYLGTLGLMIVLPMVVGAYVGIALDSRQPGYSIQWTLGLILLGLIIGVGSAYAYVTRT